MVEGCSRIRLLESRKDANTGSTTLYRGGKGENLRKAEGGPQEEGEQWRVSRRSPAGNKKGGGFSISGLIGETKEINNGGERCKRS